jgi:hypothetical protein
MIGSFAPQKEPHVMTFPRNGWDEAPSGMLHRGSYKAKSQLIDDDKQTHLEFEYSFGNLFVQSVLFLFPFVEVILCCMEY